MSKCFLLLSMIFLHIVDDYYFQGILAQMKQREWWKENAPIKLYRYDYLIALAMHSMSWSFMIMLPIAISRGFNVGADFAIAFLLNSIGHGIMDDLKANKKAVNLIIDQSFHILQIIITFIVLAI